MTPTSARFDPDTRLIITVQLFSVKEKQKKEAEAAKEGVKKQTAGELRVQKDMTELNLASTTSIAFPKGPDHLLDFEVTIKVRPGQRQAKPAWRGMGQRWQDVGTLPLPRPHPSSRSLYPACC